MSLFQLAVLFAVFLSGALAGCAGFYAKARVDTEYSRPSPTPQEVDTIERRITCVLYGKDCDGPPPASSPLIPETPKGNSPSQPAGSSSSSGEVRPTSTSSALTELTDDGSREPGLTSLDLEMSATSPLERALNLSDRVDVDRSRTPESTARSASRRNCRLCSKIRGLAGGGE